ncbi:MAG: hypothetical protein MUF84_17785 [Anaerolineae bacterium]|jgi:hypothetical protein|nr:hypothetical protein [Anaerolineae bacterium]
MSGPVYLLVLGKGVTEAWCRLTEQEQSELWGKVVEVDRRAGMKVHIVCKARWANEGLYDWGVLEYPSLEALQQKTAELEKLQWWRYWECESILGSPMPAFLGEEHIWDPGADKAHIMPRPIYILVVAKLDKEAWFQLSEEDRSELWAKTLDADRRAGAKFVVGGQSRWANEAISAWVVLEYPSIEAILQKYDDLEGKLNCFRYWACDTYLGVWRPWE